MIACVRRARGQASVGVAQGRVAGATRYTVTRTYVCIESGVRSTLFALF